ncbi:MAG: hypothetical protein HZC11_05950 [Nitrospirae bacterium]|nr:hypothetical protein [Nitrospirota bacterium]
MNTSKIKHYALIPAKEKSNRCRGKNWRNFIEGYCLVDFTLKTIPKDVFNEVILSTDKADYQAPLIIKKHKRDKSLAAKDSCVLDLMQLIIREYQMTDKDYLWLLNPTAPFRLETDYRCIRKIINKDLPTALISVRKIHPFIWKNDVPLFETKGKRLNTEDFREEFAIENGMFYVVNVGYFRKNSSWYGKDTRLYKQDSIWSSVDIDTENDFKNAQKLEKLWEIKLGGNHVQF